jgi:RNA polymerase sigma-70 factor, ECF subfamily
MAETELTATLQADLARGFECLVLAYQQRLYAFTLRLIGHPSDAEEIAQEALIRAYTALQGYPPERIATLAVRPWLYQIALNLVRNRHRGARPTLSLAAEEDDGQRPEPAADTREGPEQQALRRERGRELADHLLALPRRYRAAVVLRHVAGLEYGEVAAALGVPLGTAKSDVHRGVRLLRAAMTTHPEGETT